VIYEVIDHLIAHFLTKKLKNVPEYQLLHINLVIFKHIYISQGSLAMQLRCGGVSNNHIKMLGKHLGQIMKVTLLDELRTKNNHLNAKKWSIYLECIDTILL